MFPDSTARLLAADGHNAVHVRGRGLGGHPDQEVAALAIAENRVLVTENVKDFADPDGFVVACILKSRLRARGTGEDLARLLDAWAAINPEPLSGLHWPPTHTD